jgi:hypothetical protein
MPPAQAKAALFRVYCTAASGSARPVMPSSRHDDDKTMTADAAPQLTGLAATLADAAALAAIRGPASRIGIGGACPQSDIHAPAGPRLQPPDIAAMSGRAAPYMFTFGNTAAPIAADILAPMLETCIARAGTGFCAACVATPWTDRTMYQGHLFQGASHRGNLVQDFSAAMQGRVGLVPLEVVAQGAAAIRARLAALKDQGTALALIDAINSNDCEAVVQACAGQHLRAGAAWLAGPAPSPPEPSPPAGPLAILSGATDRQTLFQLGIASAIMPSLWLDFTRPDVAATALVWAAAATRKTGAVAIAASAPPDRLHPTAPVLAILAEMARGLAAAGTTRLVLAGSDTAAAILNALGVTELTAGAALGSLRWLHDAQGRAYLIKPGGAGGRDLFRDLFPAGFRPQIRLNAAAE